MARRASSTSDVFLYFLAIFLPPLAVFFKTGCDSNFIINILLSILGWLPGVIHAWWVISRFEKPEGARAARVEPVVPAPVPAHEPKHY